MSNNNNSDNETKASKQGSKTAPTAKASTSAAKPKVATATTKGASATKSATAKVAATTRSASTTKSASTAKSKSTATEPKTVKASATKATSVDNKADVKEFRAESKRLLDMMINSVYSNKEVFLRELISNASDALDKLYFKTLTDSSIKTTKDDLQIEVVRDSASRTLVIRDNGIGMSREDMDSHLGTIARSGSKDFRDELSSSDSDTKDKKDIDIIGQFGVGFYSSFMVATSVSVVSKTLGGEAHIWTSRGLDGYTISPLDSTAHMSTYISSVISGTEVILTLKDDDEDYKYSDLLNEYHVRELIKKYSDYIRYPIKAQIVKSTKAKDSDEYVDETVFETVNSQIPLWKKRKQDVSQDEYNRFYADKFFDFDPPSRVIQAHLEGTSEFDTLLFLPSNAPYNYYSKDYQKGLQLYASGVLISDRVQELLPDYFGFVKGVVDSADLSLNISREILQQDRQIAYIAKILENKITSELVSMQKNDRDGYDKLFKNFGLSLKFGTYDKFGQNKDKLKDLLMFYSSTQKKLVTLSEYVERIKLGQDNIYYATGESYDKIDKLPACELVKDKDYEILYLVDNIDEFVFKILETYSDKKFMSVADPKLNIGGDNAGENDGVAAQNKELLDAIKNALSGKVEDVVISSRLKTHAVCLSAKGEISIDMEKTLSSMPNNENIKAQKVLEINPNHKVMQRLVAGKDDTQYIAKMSGVLYSAARLIEGLPIEDSVEFVGDILDLI